jgi:hypothetical protein
MSGSQSGPLKVLGQSSLSERVSAREKLILAGLYLPKYDQAGLDDLGFESFTEAFNSHRVCFGVEARVYEKLPGRVRSTLSKQSERLA